MPLKLATSRYSGFAVMIEDLAVLMNAVVTAAGICDWYLGVAATVAVRPGMRALPRGARGPVTAGAVSVGAVTVGAGSTGALTAGSGAATGPVTGAVTGALGALPVALGTVVTGTVVTGTVVTGAATAGEVAGAAGGRAAEG